MQRRSYLPVGDFVATTFADFPSSFRPSIFFRSLPSEPRHPSLPSPPLYHTGGKGVLCVTPNQFLNSQMMHVGEFSAFPVR